jgi:hypothetical protein
MTRPEGSAALIGFWSIIVQEPLSGHFSPVRTVVPIGHKPEIVAAMAVPQYLWPPAWAAPASANLATLSAFKVESRLRGRTAATARRSV